MKKLIILFVVGGFLAFQILTVTCNNNGEGPITRAVFYGEAGDERPPQRPRASIAEVSNLKSSSSENEYGAKKGTPSDQIQNGNAHARIVTNWNDLEKLYN